MNFPFFIARRYLFAKKSHNVINVISAISVAGIMLASFALICTLSVFNGFHELVESLFKDFDPELKVVSTDHKFFKTDDEKVNKACNLDFIDICTFTLEEQALLSYKSKQQICMIKGVEDSYHDLVGIENLLKGSGIFMLQDEVCNYGIMGIGLMNKMDCGVKPAYPLRLAVPKKQGNISLSNPAASFNQASIYSPGTVFCVEQEKYDDNYVIISLPLAQQLTDREGEASAMEIKLTDGYSLRKARRELESVLGPEFKVQDRLLQQQDVFKVFKLEKLISYLFLTFILLIACFNIIGSLNYKRHPYITFRCCIGTCTGSDSSTAAAEVRIHITGLIGQFHRGCLSGKHTRHRYHTGSGNCPCGQFPFSTSYRAYRPPFYQRFRWRLNGPQ